MNEPCLKRWCRSLGPLLNEPYESDGDSSACLSDDAAESDESTADERTNNEIATNSDQMSPMSSYGQPEDYEINCDGQLESDEDEDEEALAWWAAGPDGPLRFLMRLEFDLLDKLNGHCLTSAQQPLPNASGWVLDDEALFELANELES